MSETTHSAMKEAVLDYLELQRARGYADFEQCIKDAMKEWLKDRGEDSVQVVRREEELLGTIERMAGAIGCNHTDSADGRARLSHCIEDVLAEKDKVISWAQAVLTALNVGDVAKDSKLHHKLREVMIDYRERTHSTTAQ